MSVSPMTARLLLQLRWSRDPTGIYFLDSHRRLEWMTNVAEPVILALQKSPAEQDEYRAVVKQLCIMYGHWYGPQLAARVARYIDMKERRGLNRHMVELLFDLVQERARPCNEVLQ